MGNKLLITGGTGFFGRALLRHFFAEARRMPSGRPQEFSEIIVISRNPEKFAARHQTLAIAPWLRWVRADVCDRPALDALLPGETLHAVLHAATDSTDAAAMWRIRKLSTSGSLFIIKWADGDDAYDNIWNNRASLTYS